MFRLVVLSLLVAAVAAGPPVAKSRADIEEYKQALEKTREGTKIIIINS